MQVRELWELPIFSHLIEDGVSVCPVGDGFVLSFEYWDEEDKEYKLVKLVFENVVFFKNESESTCFDPLDSYDRLVELPDSDLLVALAHQAPHFDFTPFHHYAIYFESAGLYQFIAKIMR